MLEQLFPVPLGGVFDGDMTVEGDSLDQAAGWVQTLLAEMFPQTASVTIEEWEARYAITPAAGEALQQRQAAVLAAIQARGGLSIPYFTALAAVWGYTIEIEELPPNSTDPAVPEGSSGTPETVFIWRIHPIAAPVVYFRAGQSCAGEPLDYAPTESAVEALFQKLKPAHTMFIFASS